VSSVHKVPIRVSIVEDNDPFREHLAALIGGAQGFSCSGAHRTAEQALKRIPVEKPDIVLLDLELPHLPGEECIRELKARLPGLEIVVLTIHDDSRRIFDALEAGATGYLVKPVAPAKILEALTEAAAGGAPMSSQIARLVIHTFHERGQRKQELKQLTAREEEILAYVAKGYQSPEIAAELGISLSTVSTHLHHIYEKLQVRTRVGAAAKYLRHGASE
jgi:DNA-binding NarL/FixJ family response regulator